MAIFTIVANYLKCRYYFESVLGFRLIEKYPDESDEDFNNDIADFTTLGGEPDIESYGIFCRRSNRIIANNIWFLYGKARSWYDFDEGVGEHVPKELEQGFVLRNESGNEGSDYCGFVLDPAGTTSDFEFIGMKRLLPLSDEEDGQGVSDLNNKNKVQIYKDYLSFIKLKIDSETGETLPPEKLTNYDVVLPVSDGDNGLNTKQPNSLLIKTVYDYEDFGFDNTGKEYNVRQIGLLTNLHITTQSQQYIKYKETLYNGMEENSIIFPNLCDLFNITEESIIVPSNLVLEDRFTSLINGDFNYNVLPSYLKKELHLDGIDTNSAVTQDNSFFGILQFYMNSLPNNRVTYQTDTYNFILSFENQIKCTCDFNNCNV